MIAAPIPPNEAARLNALQSYHLLDSPADIGFEEIVRRAAKIFGASVSALALIDRDRQWFLSKIGLEVSEGPRRIAICAHTIMDAQPLILDDARLDPRFANNPFVTSDPPVIFYAGAPLIGRGGFGLGSLCVTKPTPHKASPTECKQLVALARLAVSRMELHKTKLILSGKDL